MINMRRLLTLFLFVIALGACTDIDPGYEGFVHRPYSTGLDTGTPLKAGMHSLAPWNDVFKFSVQEKSVNERMEVLDSDGLAIGIDVSAIYSVNKGMGGQIKENVGMNYESVKVVPYLRSATREVVGQFTAEEIYSTKRGELQGLITGSLNESFGEFYTLHDLLIKDVDLPVKIKAAIENKMTEAQAKLQAEEKQIRMLTEARTDSAARVTRAAGQAEEIRLIQQTIKSSPGFLRLREIEAWEKGGSQVPTAIGEFPFVFGKTGS